MATTQTRKCPRCCGKGSFSYGVCFCCWGGGVIEFTVYTAEEKADIRMRGARRRDALATVRECAPKLDAHLGLHAGDDTYADWAFWGFGCLEENPERFTKMLDSIEAGRVYDVIRALADYAKAHATKNEA